MSERGSPELTRTCTSCKERKYLREFHLDCTRPGGYATRCKACRRKKKRPAGICVDCDAEVRGVRRCEPCRVKHQRLVMFEAPPQQPGPTVCGIPMRGGWCHEALQFSVDRAGLTVVWCCAHGERVAPRIRPTDAQHPRHKGAAA